MAVAWNPVPTMQRIKVDNKARSCDCPELEAEKRIGKSFEAYARPISRYIIEAEHRSTHLYMKSLHPLGIPEERSNDVDGAGRRHSERILGQQARAS